MREQLLQLADRLPTGRRDPKAWQKFWHEMSEFNAETSRVAMAAELADLTYYRAKMSFFQRFLVTPTWRSACHAVGVNESGAYQIAIAKYELRARPGNPKNHAAENAAIQKVLDRL